ncbi:MAG: flavodoxin family protein [Desulfobacula sp.]|nr:flavodoxin family protein [Desulfobacula sp.]
MSKKIVFIQGSPRKKGNTRAMAALAMAAAREKGAQVAELDALGLGFKEAGCRACQKCQDSELYQCVLGDEVAEKVAVLPEYDTLVLATPIYWWSYPAQLKILIDRMYCLSKFSGPAGPSSALTGKTLAILATGGGGLEDNLSLLESQWQQPALMLGTKFLSCLFPDVSPEPGSLLKDPSAVEKAKDFGRILAGS